MGVCSMMNDDSRPTGDAVPPPHMRGDGVDMHIIFPPQWSPFQPFLSIPSLKAYLSREGYNIEQSDLNIRFYRWFISPERLQRARQRLLYYADHLSDEYEEYRAKAIYAYATLQQHETFYEKTLSLCEDETFDNIEAVYEASSGLKRLLEAFSTAEPVIDVGTSSFSAHSVLQDFASMEEFCIDGEDNPFVDFFHGELAKITEKPRYFGVSIIGNEQIVPGLTLCKALKQCFPDVPIVIGGSVFLRLLDKDENLHKLFGTYFDYICCYEGERPMAAFLAANDPIGEHIEGFAYLKDGQVVQTDIMEPLSMDDVPTPNFDGMPLHDYFTPEPVLPLLSTRGCYWGKCAFCYHGMIYQERYRMRQPHMIAEDVDRLNKRYGARHFAFNDEAIPPKLFKLLPPELVEGKYFFTGLYKFEKYFTRKHFEDMFKAGFRSLYIGFEAASERIQRHMLKDNTQDVMVSNLRDAHEVGIWSHTFGFFGFPTETHEEAQETVKFLLDHVDIIHSEGTGVFSFEHNAPIHQTPEAFGVTKVKRKPGRIFELYYDYEVASGMSEEEASTLVALFDEKKKKKFAYQGGRWIPRELLLVLLGRYARDDLRKQLDDLEIRREKNSRTLSCMTWVTLPGEQGKQRFFAINTGTGQVFETNEDTLSLFTALEQNTPMSNVAAAFPALVPMMVDKAVVHSEDQIDA